ncbi:MAG: hypothetical protein FGM36_12850 [Burkholderiaceae bacterium]|nr:hypothetical protein [Burkholderiaceae bacterium]
MAALTLDYRHCSRKRPLYPKHAEVEAIALMARQQLVASGVDALTLDILSGIARLKINGVAVNLAIDTQNTVHDESGQAVLGICEYDPGVPDTAMVSVSPCGEDSSEELVLSTLAHEIGHAIFDSPGWIVDASRGPGLFDEVDDGARRVYRTTTRDSQHLANSTAEGHNSSLAKRSENYFAELRANEFMGSLLVPRQRLYTAVEEMAPMCNVTIVRGPSLDPEFEGAGITVQSSGAMGFFHLESLQRAIASRFNVSPRFIQVRMERYGLLKLGGFSA